MLSAATLALLPLLGCTTTLPDPDSPGARLYTQRCVTSCHGAYPPSTMKFAMWTQMVDRMQGEMVRRGVPPLTDKEVATLLDYLKRHSG